LLPTAFAVLSLACLGNIAKGDEVSVKAPQVIVLKLDDVVAQRSPDGLPVSARWQRVTEFLKKSNIKASYGIIGFSLEEDNEAYFNWIKDLHNGGLIEFWNHGYRNRKATDRTVEFEGSFEEQKVALERTQKLAKEKLGIELKAFGPHWSGTNEGTAKALEGIPEITMWFYGPSSSSKFVFPRFLTLENPTHVPDFDKFKTAYEKVGHDKKCLALQGHPKSWDDERWENFVKIIDYLKSKGCVFMTPSEYREKVTADGNVGKAF
jgi:peptidoglycan/xylan/chitin deacetylase (PgdA/CDA1 family)